MQRWLATTAALGVSAIAWAQEAPSPEEAPSRAADPSILPTSPEALRAAVGWRRVSPLRTGPVTDVAVDAVEGRVALAVGADGAAWLSLDAGATWFRVLEAADQVLSDDEDLLVQVEAHLEDVLDLPEADDLESMLDEGAPEEFLDADAADAAADELMDAADAVASDIRADLDAQPWLLGEGGRPGFGWRPRVALTNGAAELWVGRSDGLWLSTDVGTTWRQVLDLPTGPVAFLPARGLWVAGTADGFRFAADPLRFIDAEDGTEELRVLDLAVAPEGMYAGTDDGLWFAADAQAWIPTGPTSDAVHAVLVDPRWETGLWVATDSAVFRSDDRGRTFRATLGAPLSGVRDLVLVEPGAQVFAATNDGPWASVDGGTLWIPMVRGLLDPRTYAVAAGPDLLLLASDEGVARLVPRDPDAPDDVAPSFVPEPWIPMEELVRAATTRPGLSDVNLSGSMRRAATAMPQLRLEARFDPDRALTWSNSLGSERAADAVFTARVVLQWTPDGRKRNASLTSVVLDEGVFIDDGRDRSMLTARVQRAGVQYQRVLATEVIDLATTHAELVGRTAALAGASIADRVEHALRILEIEARLDGLTDGYVGRVHLAASQGD